MHVERVERVELVQGDGHQRVQRWLRGHPDGAGAEHVTIGTVPDGRWYATRTGMTGWGDAADEATVRALAAGWMAGDDGWREVPANYDARQRPVPPDGWVWRGGDWARAEG